MMGDNSETVHSYNRSIERTGMQLNIFKFHVDDDEEHLTVNFRIGNGNSTLIPSNEVFAFTRGKQKRK